MMKKKISMRQIFLIAIFIVFLSFYNVAIFSSIGMLAVMFIGGRLLNELGKSIPILELILVISGLQWIVGPFIIYRTQPEFMLVSEDDYMLITVIAYICFIVGCLVLRKKKAILDKEKIQFLMAKYKAVRVMKGIYWIGVFVFILSLFFSSSLNQIFNIIYSFAFLASILLMYTKEKKRNMYVIIIFALVFLKGVYFAVFAEFISQSFLLLIFIPNVYSLSKKQIFIFMGAGMLFLSIINTAKVVYRQQVWSGRGNEVNFELFFEVLFSSDNSSADDSDNSFFTRISSGMINAMIFNHVPSKISHTEGTVLYEDFVSAIVPRVLYPDKKDIDNRKNFMLYTGNYLDETTSVGVNALGIGYAEFGVFGCYVFMLVYGMFLCLIFNFFVSSSKKNVFYTFSILIAFLNVAKSETEFVGGVNGLLKSTLLIVIIIYYISKSNPGVFTYEK